MKLMHRWVLVGVLLPVAAMTGCGGGDPTYPDGSVPISLAEIVESAANGALRSLRREAGFKDQVRALLARKDELTTRAALSEAWTAIGAPMSGVDLEADVFKEATRDGNWDEEVREHYPDGNVPDSVFLTGFWKAAGGFVR